MTLSVFFILIALSERAADLEFRIFVCALLGVVGAASLFGGYQLFANSGRRPNPNLGAASFFAGFGALLIVLVAMVTFGPWRPHQEGVFPERILDLNAPPAAIERVSPTPVRPQGGARG
jgi:hypothetical protein